jgi:hypothetical protein
MTCTPNTEHRLSSNAVSEMHTHVQKTGVVCHTHKRKTKGSGRIDPSEVRPAHDLSLELLSYAVHSALLELT